MQQAEGGGRKASRTACAAATVVTSDANKQRASQRTRARLQCCHFNNGCYFGVSYRQRPSIVSNQQVSWNADSVVLIVDGARLRRGTRVSWRERNNILMQGGPEVQNSELPCLDPGSDPHPAEMRAPAAITVSAYVAEANDIRSTGTKTKTRRVSIRLMCFRRPFFGGAAAAAAAAAAVHIVIGRGHMGCKVVRWQVTSKAMIHLADAMAHNGAAVANLLAERELVLLFIRHRSAAGWGCLSTIATGGLQICLPCSYVVRISFLSRHERLGLFACCPTVINKHDSQVEAQPSFLGSGSKLPLGGGMPWRDWNVHCWVP